MQETGISSIDEAILTWLCSEWFDLQFGTPSDRGIIDNANLADATENARRKWLLRHRAVILNEIPPGAPAFHVLLEEADLPNLYIVPTGDWYLDTGSSFRLVDTPANLRQGRQADPGLQLGPIEHYDKVRAKAQYMSTHGIAADEVLIIISPGGAGPYTIIDGTHRAAALYGEHIRNPNTPWKGILIRDPLIEQSRWSVNSKLAQAAATQFRLWASQGYLS